MVNAGCLSLPCLAQCAHSLLQMVAIYDRLCCSSSGKRGTRKSGVLVRDLSGFATNQDLRRLVTVMKGDRAGLSCARGKDLPLSQTDSDHDPHPNRSDRDKDKRSVEKGFRYCVSREADCERGDPGQAQHSFAPSSGSPS
jgi:hypothetical protein